MILVELPIFDPIEEDFLRYRFDSWDGPVKLSLHHPIAEGIFCWILPASKKPTFSGDTKTITLQVPKHDNFNFERYLHHEINIKNALRIKMLIMSDYYSEVNRVINVNRNRTNFKIAITNFVDMLDRMSGDYNLSINYEQIRRMISRDDQKLYKMLSEFNKRSTYQTAV